MSDPRLELGPQLTGAAAEVCQEALDGIRPIVRVGPRLPPPAATATAALVHLLGRLHPHVEVDGDARLGPNPWRAETVSEAAEVVPRAEPTRPASHDVVVAVGGVDAADLWVGGGDWTVAVGDSRLDVEPGRSALGVHAAAALAAAEVMKAALRSLRFVHASARPYTVWNLVDYRCRPAQIVDDGDQGLVPAVALLGAGSVGSSAAALLALSGNGSTADVVDPDTFDSNRNPYRYPASTLGTSGSKAAWVGSLLAHGGWLASAHDRLIGEWTAGRELPGFEGVAISSVDRVDARADVADLLGRTTLSVGVGGLAFHVQREHPDDNAACPYCEYLTVGTPMSQLAAYEQQTGIPMARIAALLAGQRLQPGDVAAAIAAGRIHAGRAEELVGRRFEDLVRRAYAQATVRTVAGEAVAVSAPAVSWLAGAVVAAEVRKLEKLLPALDRRIDVDLSGVPTGMVRTVGRDRSGRCLCANPFRIRAARRLYRIDDGRR